MNEPSYSACLGPELLHMLASQAHAQDFHCHLRPQVQMFGQIDVGKSSLSQQTQQTVMAQLLAHTVGHGSASSCSCCLVSEVHAAFLYILLARCSPDATL